MLCCLGLFGGLAVGQSLGGPWTVVAPAAGFAVGLAADMKLMKGMHGRSSAQRARGAEAQQDIQPSRPDDTASQAQITGPTAAPAQNASCCGVASANGSKRLWVIGGLALAAVAIFAAWDWIEASGLAPILVLLLLVPFVLMCMRGHGKHGKPKEMSLAEIRKTYETESRDPPRAGA
jgi:hypothetical protein